MKLKPLLFALFIAILPLSLFSQDGTYDTSFGGIGFIIIDIDTNSDYAKQLIQQADGKILMVGVTYISSNHSSFILRYETSGDLDLSFGTDGIVTSNLRGFSEVCLQNDDKIVIGGSNSGDYFVQRYTSSGELDTTFADSGILIPISSASKINVLDDDSILLADSVTDGADNFIVLQKYLADGTPDSAYGNNGTSIVEVPFEDLQINEFKIQSDDSVIVLSTRGRTVTSDVILTKFLADGSIDNSFGTNGSTLYAIDIAPNEDNIQAAFDIAQNGNIIVAVTAGGCQTSFKRNLIRFLPNGVLDESFGNAGVIDLPGYSAIPFKVFIQENNRILLGENFLDCFEWAFLSINRYFANGSIDSSLSLDTAGWEEDGGDFILQNDGKIVAIGTTPWYNGDEDIYIGRYNNSPLGIKENTIQDVIISPNPSNGLFSLKYVNSFSSEIPYHITDVIGKIIQTGRLKDNESVIDISEAQSGIYFLMAANTTLRLIKN